MYSHLFALTNHDHLVQVNIIQTLLHNLLDSHVSKESV